MCRYKKIKDLEEREFKKYLVNYSHMDKSNYQEYTSIFDIKLSRKSTKDILDDVKKIREKISRK